MLPQLGLSEMLIIAVLALIVVGPKDLPKLMRTAGQFVRKIKLMGQDFKDAFEQMGAEEELEDLKKEIEELKALGRDTNISDQAFEAEMRALDADIKDNISAPIKPNDNKS